MSEKLPVRDFKWFDNLSMFTEEFMKNYDENGDKGYILEVDVEYPQKLHNVHSDLPFYQKEGKSINVRNLFVIHVIKKTI